MSTLVSGSFTASGNSPAFSPAADLTRKGYNVSIWGTFAATIAVSRSFDGGTTWCPLTSSGSATASFTAPCSEIIDEVEQGVLHRLSCTYTSGTANYKISQ